MRCMCRSCRFSKCLAQGMKRSGALGNLISYLKLSNYYMTRPIVRYRGRKESREKSTGKDRSRQIAAAWSYISSLNKRSKFWDHHNCNYSCSTTSRSTWQKRRTGRFKGRATIDEWSWQSFLFGRRWNADFGSTQFGIFAYEWNQKCHTC